MPGLPAQQQGHAAQGRPGSSQEEVRHVTRRKAEGEPAGQQPLWVRVRVRVS